MLMFNLSRIPISATVQFEKSAVVAMLQLFRRTYFRMERMTLTDLTDGRR